jgi:putative CocE/NonD family hydrolase
MEIEWFDAYVKQSAPAPPNTVRYFVTGDNEWRESPIWPPVGEQLTAFYLDSNAGANSLNGDGRLTPTPVRREDEDFFDYDPRKAVPTVGGALCCNVRVMAWGPLDQRKVEGRQDVLVYSTDVLKEELEVAGSPSVVVWVASSAPDTDFTAKLVDVDADGTARILTDGILRLRARHGVERVVSYRPGQVERIEIGLGVLAHSFHPGHRVRLELASSNFPKYDRNLNTGRPQADEKEQRVAHQTVFHGPTRASHLVLPVVPSK